MTKVVLVTGTSSGIGKACAEHLAARGFRVFGGQRCTDHGAAGVEFVAMDVLDDASVQAAIDPDARAAGLGARWGAG